VVRSGACPPCLLPVDSRSANALRCLTCGGMDVEGLELVELVGYAARGETWTAIDATTGTPCQVIVAAGEIAGLGARELVRFRHPHALPVDAVLPATPGRVAVRTPVPPSLTLAALLVERRALTAGEVVTVGVPVAEALAAAHDAGLAHGDLEASDIAVDEHGRPLLLGLGISGIGGQATAPADDVATLARLLTGLLGDTPGPNADAVRAALAPALAGHPVGRPTAAALARALGRACLAAPLRLAPPPPDADEEDVEADATRLGRRGGHAWARLRDRARLPARWTAPRGASLAPTWWPPRRGAAGAAIGAALLLLVLLVAPALHPANAPRAGTLDALPATVRPAAVPPPGPAQPVIAPQAASPTVVEAPDWPSVLSGLALARAAAFAATNAAGLAAADAPGSPASVVDAERLARWSAAGAHTRGGAAQVLAVRVVSAAANAAVLDTRERLPAYDVVGADGHLLEHRVASAEKHWRVTLRRTTGGWRTASVASRG